MCPTLYPLFTSIHSYIVLSFIFRPEKFSDNNSNEQQSFVTMLKTYKTIRLPIGRKKHVYCSFVEMGGKYFSIHLNEYHKELIDLNEKLQTYPLIPLDDIPKIGMSCVAKYSDDNRLYRGNIVKILPNGCNIEYVDYGNVSEVPKSDIYELPEEFYYLPECAIRFSLYDYKANESLIIKKHEFFKHLVLDDEPELQMIVKARDDNSFTQSCELYYKNQNILNMIKEQADVTSRYPDVIKLNENDKVVIKHVESTKTIFVQHYDNIAKYQSLFDELQIYCLSAQPLPRSEIKTKMICVAKNNINLEWNRAKITSIDKQKKSVVIRFIDVGNKQEIIDIKQLKIIKKKFIEIPPQVNRCSLKDFECSTSLSNAHINDLCKVFVKTFALRSNGDLRVFTVKIYGLKFQCVYLVNLLDGHVDLSNRLNKLLEITSKVDVDENEEPEKEEPENEEPEKEEIITASNVHEYVSLPDECVLLPEECPDNFSVIESWIRTRDDYHSDHYSYYSSDHDDDQLF